MAQEDNGSHELIDIDLKNSRVGVKTRNPLEGKYRSDSVHLESTVVIDPN